MNLGLVMLWAVALIFGEAIARVEGQSLGCHKVGFLRFVDIPDCVVFNISTNACHGYCESISLSSTPDVLLANPNQVVTSFGECCNIMETEDVSVKVACLEGVRSLVFKSAKTCSCFRCKKDITLE